MDVLSDMATRVLGPFHFVATRVTLRALGNVYLHSDAGQTIRGALGTALRTVLCQYQGAPETCEGCIHMLRCAYKYLFEDGAPPAIPLLLGEDRAQEIQKTQPYILRPPMNAKRVHGPGGRFSFDLVLVGKASQYLPYIAEALIRLGMKGLGGSGGRFIVESIESLGVNGMGQPLYIAGDSFLRGDPIKIACTDLLQRTPPERRCTVRFLSRVRIFKKKKLLPIDFPLLFRTLQKRIISLAHIHCGIDVSDLLGASGALTDAAYAVQTEYKQWEKEKGRRFSRRQQDEIPTDGFKGVLTFSGDLDPFWPYLLLGLWVHVGKNATMGLGRYELLQDARSSRQLA